MPSGSTRHHHELTLVLLSSILVQVLRVMQAYCLGLALGVSAPVWAYFVFIPLIVIIMQVPIIDDTGTSQLAFDLFFQQVGVPSPQAVALDPLRRPCARRQPAWGAALHDRFGEAIEARQL